MGPSKTKKKSSLQQATSPNESLHTSLNLVELHGTTRLTLEVIDQTAQNLEIFGALLIGTMVQCLLI